MLRGTERNVTWNTQNDKHVQTIDDVLIICIYCGCVKYTWHTPEKLFHFSNLQAEAFRSEVSKLLTAIVNVWSNPASK